MISTKKLFSTFESDKSGTGLIATEKITKNQILFKEKPLICGQYSWGVVYGYDACHHCLKSLESPLHMVRRLTADPGIILPFPDPSVCNMPSISCPGCEAKFCSEKCLKSALDRYHSAVCTNGDTDHPLLKLDEMWRHMHYPPESTSLIFIVKIIGMIIVSGKIPEMLQGFYHAVEHKGNVHRVLRAEFISQLNLLRDGLLQIYGDNNTLVQQFLSQESFATFIALLGMNGQGIGSSSFAEYCRNIETSPLSDDDKIHFDKWLDQIYEKIEAESGVFTDVEGTGLYELQSKLNHSCDPNVQILFEAGNDELTVKAIRDIEKGEELCISYISSCQMNSSRHSRRKFLAENYLFECECAKCTEQYGDPDVTSNESEDEDGEDEVME